MTAPSSKRARSLRHDDAQMITQSQAAAKLRLVALMVKYGVIALDGFRIDATVLDSDHAQTDGGGTFTLTATVDDAE